MERNLLRKPKLFFDTAPHPSNVTFDDGRDQRRNLPWSHYVEARWDHGDLDTLKVEFANWLVVIRGNNLGPLFLAVEEQTLARLCAQPSLAEGREREADTFATEIKFVKPPSGPRKGQVEFDLGLG